MRLLPESRFYLCEICCVHFLYLDSVPLVYGLGFFLISVGVFLIIFMLSADRLGFGYPGIGLAEKAGIVLGIVITFIGAIFALLVLTLTFKK